MEVIVAPNKINVYSGYKLDVFLAGGITNCHDWQSEVIEYLKQYEVNNKLDLRVYNPRRPNFNIETDDPEEQIRWEYNNIKSADIFSMYFCNSESDQPICMYELGMRLGRLSENTNMINKPIIISIEKGYKRTNDIIIQTKLATNNKIKVNTDSNPICHAYSIIKAYKNIIKYKQYNKS